MIYWCVNLYDPSFVKLNLATFASSETSLELWVLLENIGLFELWIVALLVIGYSVAAKLTKLRAAACVVGLWVGRPAFLVGAAALE